jgi:hypothetical protein
MLTIKIYIDTSKPTLSSRYNVDKITENVQGGPIEELQRRTPGALGQRTVHKVLQ